MSAPSRHLPDSIILTWHVDDVAEIREDLDIAQRRMVLDKASRCHDPSIGINWDVLVSIANVLFPE